MKNIPYKFQLVLWFIGVLLIQLLPGCTDEDKIIENKTKELFLYGEFSNPPDTTPKLDINENKSSEEIEIPDQQQASIEDDRINLEFTNFRIQDGLGVYDVDRIITEEFREGKWVEDSENFLKQEETKELDVVLVLDISSSLGSDVEDVKVSAKEFVKNLFSDVDQPNIGIVGFSNSIQVKAPTPDEGAITNFIDDLQPGEDATKLYQAMDRGLAMIDTVTGSQGKSLVTFTDGRNNAWDTVAYETSDLIFDKLTASDVASYTIGFEGKGGVDNETLDRLAVDGLSSFPETTDDVEKVFLRFANSVASSNRLVYDRNKSPITDPIELRFRFKTELQ